MAGSGYSPSGHARKFNCCPERHRAFFLILIILNSTVVLVAIVALVARGLEAEDGSKGCRPSVTEEADTAVAPLSVPCSMVENNITKQEEEGGGSWMRYTDAVGDELCSPLDYRHLASAVALIFRTVLEEENGYLNRKPIELLTYYDDNPTTPKETLLFTNHYKPLGHVTGTASPKDKSSRNSNSGKGSDVFMVSDWPLRVEYYRSYTNGFVQRMRWGLAVPVSGVYRVHSTVNFFFTYPMSRRGKDDTKEKVPIIHQISRYHARDGTFSVITERNHSASSERTDGLTSFLVHLTHLDVGDVICISMSFASDIVVYDRWHTEGLALVN